MQFCDFSNSRIQSNKNTKTMLDASNLNQSCFYKTELHDLLVENTSISQSQFFQTKIYGCEFTHTTLQDNIFRDAEIQSSSFIGCNMEFSVFHNIILKDVTLPFHQIAYIFNGLQTIATQVNNVKITSSMKGAPILSVEEYIKLLPLFSDYYFLEREFFPLANIALFEFLFFINPFTNVPIVRTSAATAIADKNKSIFPVIIVCNAPINRTSWLGSIDAAMIHIE